MRHTMKCPITNDECDLKKPHHVDILTPLGVKKECICDKCAFSIMTPTELTTVISNEKCPQCGTEMTTVMGTGKPGCPKCYEHFAVLRQIIPFMQGGGRMHCGKTPKTIETKSHIAVLKEMIADSVRSEKYEDAAELRDQIRSLEREISRESK